VRRAIKEWGAVIRRRIDEWSLPASAFDSRM
jgi:hypothetical protein